MESKEILTAEQFLRDKGISFEFPLSKQMKSIIDSIYLVDTTELEVADAMREYAIMYADSIKNSLN